MLFQPEGASECCAQRSEVEIDACEAAKTSLFQSARKLNAEESEGLAQYFSKRVFPKRKVFAATVKYSAALLQMVRSTCSWQGDCH